MPWTNGQEGVSSVASGGAREDLQTRGIAGVPLAPGRRPIPPGALAGALS